MPGRRPSNFLELLQGQFSTEAWDINSAGQIVGRYMDWTRTRAFLREKDGRIMFLDPPGSVGSRARAINSAGQVTGVYSDGHAAHGFLWQKRIAVPRQ